MKLDNFPLILWINLDHSVDRKKYMEFILEKHNLRNVRISAIDGVNDKSKLNQICDVNPIISPAENACTCSHLKALQYFINETNEERVIIFEDDVSFEFLEYIPFDWSIFEEKLPKNYNIIQLAVTDDKNVFQKFIIPRNKNYCSTNAYLITRHAAKEIIKKYIIDNRYILNNKEKCVADDAIYNINDVYVIPIFTGLNKNSIIHPSHLYYQQKSKRSQLKMWLSK